MNKNSSFKYKITISISKKNKISYINITRIYQSLKKLHSIPKERNELVTHGVHYMHQRAKKKKTSRTFLLSNCFLGFPSSPLALPYALI